MRLDGDDLSFVCTHCRGLVRRSCLVVMSCGEAEVVLVVPADGRAASWRELGGARPFVRACGVAICDAGRCSVARGRCVAHRARARRVAICPTGRAELVLRCIRARARALNVGRHKMRVLRRPMNGYASANGQQRCRREKCSATS